MYKQFCISRRDEQFQWILSVANDKIKNDRKQEVKLTCYHKILSQSSERAHGYKIQVPLILVLSAYIVRCVIYLVFKEEVFNIFTRSRDGDGVLATSYKRWITENCNMSETERQYLYVQLSVHGEKQYLLCTAFSTRRETVFIVYSFQYTARNSIYCVQFSVQIFLRTE